MSDKKKTSHKKEDKKQKDLHSRQEGSLGGEASQTQQSGRDDTDLGDIDYIEEDIIGVVGPESNEDVANEEL